jgi:3-oxoacyl-[acyl-carrier-protein] synthase II
MSPVRSVVITGLGAVSAIGLDRQSYWDSLVAGRTGTKRLSFDWMNPEEFVSQIGAPVEGFDLARRGFQARDLRLLDPACRFAIAAAMEAFEHAGIKLLRQDGKTVRFQPEAIDRDRVATFVGSGVGGLSSFEAVHSLWTLKGSFRGKGFAKYGLPMLIPNAPAANVAIALGLRGECNSAPTACAAGTMSIGGAFNAIASDQADVAVAGGAECVLSDLDGLGMIGFDNLRVMSDRNDDAAHASRPFDVERRGFVLGEGAGLLILEEEAHAKARGARILARLKGYASTADAHSMLQPDPAGAMVERAMRLALDRAGLTPAEIGYLNVHGTGTPAGDPVEAAAVRRVFGDSSAAPLVSATKSMTGHCIGASGGLEAIATVQALLEDRVHPTANLERVDEGCELNHVVGAAAEVKLQAAMSNSYGFGGHDAVLVFGRA